MRAWLTLPFVCLRAFLQGLAEGPGAVDPHDPFPRKPERRPDNPDAQWRAGALPMRRPGQWHKGD